MRSAIAVLLLLVACSKKTEPECTTFVDCEVGEVCFDEMCVMAPDAGRLDAGTDAPIDSTTPDAATDAGDDAATDARDDATADAAIDGGLDAGADAGVDAPPDAAMDAAPMDAPMDAGSDYIAFVSSRTYSANLGGIVGADAECQSMADAAGLVGRFRAILSSSTAAARDRLVISGSVVDTASVLLAADSAELWSGSIRIPLNRNESGSLIGTSIIWTGSDSDGTRDGSGGFCGDWLGTSGGAEAGRTDRNDVGWISIYGDGSSGHACSNASRIYCIRTDA